MRKLLLFQIGKRQFGLDLPLIANIQKARTFTEEVSETGEAFVLTQEGIRASLVDLCVILNGGIPMVSAGEKELILVNMESESLGLKVERVNRVVAVEEDRIESLPAVFGNPSLACFPLVLKHEDGLILLMEPEGIREARKLILKKTGTEDDLTQEIVDAFEDELEIIELTEVIKKAPEPEEELPESFAEVDALFPEKAEPVDLETLYPETEPISGDELPPMEVIPREDAEATASEEPEAVQESMEDFFARMMRTRKISDMIFDIVRSMAEEAVKKKLSEMVGSCSSEVRPDSPRMAKSR